MCGFASAFILVVSAEMFLRILGYTPTVVDDADLWALHRSRLNTGANDLALIGNSQLMWALSPSIIRQMNPKLNPRMLAAEGSSPVPVLADLARDSFFSGKVLCALNPADILPLQHGEQAALVAHYNHGFRLNSQINRVIGTWLQSHLSLMDPYANPRRLFQEWIAHESLPDPRPVLTLPDRSRRFDYSRVNVRIRQESQLVGTEALFKNAKQMGHSVWYEHANILSQYADTIEMRGGLVVFIRLPVSPEAWEAEEKYFPKITYWDKWINSDGLKSIHFKEHDVFNSFDYPDYFHIDAKDVPEFTAAIMAIAESKDFL